ncbi:MAG: type III polyketide synthase [Rhodospirillales bacterium]|nr:type III polyketide synthase [Rhodospirillales bacterium]
MAPRPRLLGIATAVPSFVMDQADVARVTAELFGGSDTDFEKFVPVYANAAIKTRYSCVSLDWYTRAHGLQERNALFIENAVNLLEQAADRALLQAGLGRADVDAVVAVSTSGIATPSLDALIIERMQLRPDVERLPVFGLGCVGGVTGLARAGQMACSRPGTNVLLLVVELCGLTFRHQDRSKSNIIATALFGDGAAAAIIRSDAGVADRAPVITAWGEHTWPDTLGIMGWTVEDDGLGVLFSRSIPALIRRDYRPALDRFLQTNDLTLAAIDHFAIHPGGAKVVNALEESLGFEPGHLSDSRAILKAYGNMSAATVLFVLERILKEPGPPGQILLSSLGPGFTAGFLVLEAL